MTKRKSTISPFEEAHFRFGLIAPVIQNVYPDASARAYYRRVTEKPILCPDGIAREYKPATLEKWTTLYRAKGIDGLTPEERSDKGTTRVLNDAAVEEIYRIREKYPRITGVNDPQSTDSGWLYQCWRQHARRAAVHQSE